MRKEIDRYGTIKYYNDQDQFHRLDGGPAAEYTNGSKYWYQNGILHRVDGPAVEYGDGAKYWYQYGKHHRIDGPAIEYANGTKYWYKNGLFHREDGPAVEWADGQKEYWIDGEQVTEFDFMLHWIINILEEQQKKLLVGTEI